LFHVEHSTPPHSQSNSARRANHRPNPFTHPRVRLFQTRERASVRALHARCSARVDCGRVRARFMRARARI